MKVSKKLSDHQVCNKKVIFQKQDIIFILIAIVFFFIPYYQAKGKKKTLPLLALTYNGSLH